VPSSPSRQADGPRRAAQERRQTLTRGEIVDAAVSLVDEHGVAALTMRSLAARLDANTASIYWHIGGRDDLLGLASAAVLSGARWPADGADWRDTLRGIADAFRTHLLDHPHFATLMVQSLTLSATSIDLVERIVATLHGAGLRGAALRRSYNAYIGYVVGFTVIELGPLDAEDEGQWAELAEAELTGEGARRHPVLALHRAEFENAAFAVRWPSGAHTRMDDSFWAGLDALLAGFAASLATAAADGPAAGR
jgi:AcrR family transcriptional regulator